MARIYEQALEELNDIREELEAAEAMSEAEACDLYNVNYKIEIVNALNEEIESLEREVESLTPVSLDDDVTEIFGSYVAMNLAIY